MTRTSSVLIALIVLGGLAGYTFVTRADRDSPPASDHPVPAAPPAAPAPEARAAVVAETTNAAAAIPPATVESLAASATGDDPAKRAAAIRALADAPKAAAIPVLRVVMTSGESRVDRPLALRSLRSLAQREGDADGAIRDVLRQAVYHGDNEDFVRATQAVLDDVEGLVSQR